MSKPTRTEVSSSSVALTASYKLLTIAGVPDGCWLVSLRGSLNTVVTGVTVTWKITADAAGDIKIKGPLTETIEFGVATADDGGVSSNLEIDYALPSDGVSGTVYVWAKLNAGTANMVASLTFREER